MVLQNLLELVASEMASEHCQADKALLKYYNNTLQHIRAQKKKDEAAERYKAISV